MQKASRPSFIVRIYLISLQTTIDILTIMFCSGKKKKTFYYTEAFHLHPPKICSASVMQNKAFQL